MTKYQGLEASAHPEVPEDLDVESIDHTEVPEDNEVTVEGGRYERNTHNTP